MVSRFSKRQLLKSYFDELASSYESRYRGETSLGYSLRIVHQRVCEVFDRAGTAVLDVGCGTGILLKSLIDQECEVYGVDLSFGMIRICQKRFANIDRARFAVAEVEDLPFSSDLFDAVICKGVFDFVVDDDLVIAELTRVTKPGGSIIITFQQRFSLWRLWTHHVATLRSGYSVRHRSHRASVVSALLRRNGLVLEEVLYCNFQLFLKPLDRLVPELAVNVARALDRGLCRNAAFSWLATCFVVKAAKP